MLYTICYNNHWRHPHTFLLCQSLPGGAQVATQLSVMTHLQDKVDIVAVLEVVVKFKDGRVLESALYLHLITYPGNHTARLHQLLINLSVYINTRTCDHSMQAGSLDHSMSIQGLTSLMIHCVWQEPMKVFDKLMPSVHVLSWGDGLDYEMTIS